MKKTIKKTNVMSLLNSLKTALKTALKTPLNIFLNIFLVTILISLVLQPLFSEPHPKHHQEVQQVSAKKKKEIKANVLLQYDYVLDIKGLVCSFCANKLRKSFKKVDFIKIEKKKDLFVNLKKQKVFFKIYADKPFDLQKIKKIVTESGYQFMYIGIIRKGIFKKKTGAKSPLKPNEILFVTKSQEKYTVAEDIAPKKLKKIKKQLKRKKRRLFTLFFKNLTEKKIYKIKFIK